MLAQSAAPFRTSRAAPPRAARKNPRSTGESSPRRRVLVVDDDPLVRWFVAETLRAEGAATYEAADGDSALRLLAAHPGAVQVVLLDLSLPDCTDLRLLRAIRRLTPAPVVIMMTAFGSPEIRREALSLGVKAFLDKPFEMSDLPGIIERCLAGDSIK